MTRSQPESGRSPRRSDGILRPVDYTARRAYRPPPALYRRLQVIALLINRLGLSADYVVTLEVPGRRTGVVRSTSLVQVGLDGQRYLVALSGESEWVRNVRAAQGRAVLGRRTRYAVTLVDVPPAERAPVIHAYLHRPGRRGVPIRRDREAISYFGVDPDATVADLEAIVERYPIFRVTPV